MKRDELKLELMQIWSALDHLDPMLASIEETGGSIVRIDEVRSELNDAMEWIWALMERVEREGVNNE